MYLHHPKNFFLIKKIACFILVLLLISCSAKNETKNHGFISIEGKTFKLKGKDFYPMILNYGVDLMAANNTMWISPMNTGFKNSHVPPHAKTSDLLRFKADMQMILDLGFNTVRLYAIGEYKVKDNVICKAADTGSKDTMLVLNGESMEKYLTALTDMLKICNEVGMKAIILTKKNPDTNELTDAHLSKMLNRFKDEKSILAWDFFNEPLYFDEPPRKKEDVYTLVKGWKKFARIYAPNQLLTIGLTGTREMFEWDPNILDVDFLSIHPYEFHKGEVENEMYWYAKYVKKPWVIGETGYSADGDSVGFDTQKLYAEKFLKRAVNCGASGFSWWQYQDVQWYNFQSNFLGLLTGTGTTATSKKELIVTGTLKSAASIFKNFDTKTKTEECTCRDNYYNYDGLNQFAVKGKLINNETGEPIEGGGVVAWDQYCGKSNITFSKPDGSFILYGNYKLYHSIASATMMDAQRQEFDWDKVVISNENGVPTYNLGTIKLIPLKLTE